ncbi:hypothetical protein LCGC14_0343870 [marine sediment metagenome]|uniref:Uncharacterized protein n=1 Tax=marine sediment metagenome TaxID=412755 RepID=A0A0F9TII0_9ZZZZ
MDVSFLTRARFSRCWCAFRCDGIPLVLKAGFGPCAEIHPLSFETLENADIWISEALGPAWRQRGLPRVSQKMTTP